MTKHKVVLVPFPFDDLSSDKVRPAVCLTDPISQHRHVVLAFISSQVPETLLETDLLISTKDADFEGSGLRVSSVLRLHRMMTATTRIIRRELGRLSEEQQKAVNDRLKILFHIT